MLQGAAQRARLASGEVLAGVFVIEDEVLGLYQAAQVRVGLLQVGVLLPQSLCVVLQAGQPLIAAGGGGLLLLAHRRQALSGGGGIGPALGYSGLGGCEASL